MEKMLINNWYSEVDDYVFNKCLDGELYGTIKLPVPVANIHEWYAVNPSVYALLLGMTRAELEKILYYCVRIVDDPMESGFEPGQALDEASYKEAVEGGKAFSCLTGLPAVLFLLDRIDHKKVFDDACAEEKECMAWFEKYYEETDEAEEDCAPGDGPFPAEENPRAKEAGEVDNRLVMARSLIDAVLYVREHRDRLVINEIHLFPLEIRRMIRNELSARPYSVCHDLMRMYGRIANRCERIRKLSELNAPEIILINEKRMLQESVDALLSNGTRGRTLLRSGSACADERCGCASLMDIIMHSLKIA